MEYMKLADDIGKRKAACDEENAGPKVIPFSKIMADARRNEIAK